jgi:hypothetical protein
MQATHLQETAMTQSSGFDFTKFVPGFDFLKNLTPGATGGGASAPGWVAPTLDPDELEKRIQELKTVHFWLEQNTKAVAATIQALEVQRMTLSTLKGMNLSFHELAESLKVKADASAAPFATATAETSEATPQDKPAKAASSKAKSTSKSAGKSSKASKTAAAGVDPSQWWGALTDQFQHIAHKAMQDMAHSANSHAGAASAAGAEASTSKPKPAAQKSTRKTARPAARKATAKTSR